MQLHFDRSNNSLNCVDHAGDFTAYYTSYSTELAVCVLIMILLYLYLMTTYATH